MVHRFNLATAFISLILSLPLLSCGNSSTPNNDGSNVTLTAEELRSGCTWSCPTCKAGETCPKVACKIQCGAKCGNRFCPQGETCCSPSCGTCSSQSTVCPQIACQPDPCFGVSCAQGQHCEVQDSKGVCVPTVCPEVACLSVPCTNGYAKDRNGCDTCVCLPPPQPKDCSYVTCAKEEQCQMKDGAPVCVPVACPQISCPTIACENGQTSDANGCPTCGCNPVPVKDCTSVTCPAQQQCVMQSGAPACVPVACPKLMCPVLECPYGVATDANGCPTCGCNPPTDCGAVTCTAGQHCEKQSDGTATCVVDSCPTLMCLVGCPYGYVTDPNGCKTCTCLPAPPADCSKLTCPTGQHCVVNDGAATCQPVVCPMFACFLACPNGYAKNANGCPICRCK